MSRLPDPRRLLDLAPLYRGFQGLLGARRARAAFVEWASPRPGQRLLDVGCGPGDLVAHLPAGVEVVGLDLHPGYVAAARARWGGRAQFVVGSAGGALAAGAEGSFDVVVAAFLLHHLDDGEAAAFAAAACRLLAPGGTLATIDPVLLPGQRPVARALAQRDRGRHVRDAAATAALLAASFPPPLVRVRGDLLRIPYDHVLLRTIRP